MMFLVRILPLLLDVDFREEKRGIRQRRKANRAPLAGYEITGARYSGIFMGILSIAIGSLFKITAVPFREAVGRTTAYRW
ncbi:hypothetical protein E3N88_13880 [Mikania micrantha]|uniref:Uncharacterized protein n=1 Tax=Mikania micrantha TaxID=192012 RepID=A0A5N6NZS2_9ASTR|nr:hypothetical protein E3N88_13880 [Mikania micrantha]